MNALRKSAPLLAAALAATLAACAPGANTGRTAVSDEVKFDYTLSPTAKPHDYRLALKLADAKSGAAIQDANVALSLFGPGYPGGTLINLHREPGGDAAGGGAMVYAADVGLPQAANYQLTFQVNRPPPAKSAEAIFQSAPPSGN
ncbi:MAG: hypothetical protein ACXU8S_03365 [Phenylobacterium sp.]